ncbi:hypothetical protein DL93DRAFT_2162819 [Clavulina sp. PMI_390]|nr:hypothetical protein DL93DRAFT_2162819 [Clavulina sp. PMI_390]
MENHSFSQRRETSPASPSQPRPVVDIRSPLPKNLPRYTPPSLPYSSGPAAPPLGQPLGSASPVTPSNPMTAHALRLAPHPNAVRHIPHSSPTLQSHPTSRLPTLIPVAVQQVNDERTGRLLVPQPVKGSIVRSKSESRVGRSHSLHGCWTCRGRKKRCPLEQDDEGNCSACKRLDLECLQGYEHPMPKGLKVAHVLPRRARSTHPHPNSHLKKSLSPSAPAAQTALPPTIVVTNPLYAARDDLTQSLVHNDSFPDTTTMPGTPSSLASTPASSASWDNWFSPGAPSSFSGQGFGEVSYVSPAHAESMYQTVQISAPQSNALQYYWMDLQSVPGMNGEYSFTTNTLSFPPDEDNSSSNGASHRQTW